MKSLPLFFVNLLLLFFQELPAQQRNYGTDTELLRCEVKLDRQYIKGYWQDFKYLAKSPARWEKEEWLWFGGVLGAGATLYAFDQPIFDWFQANRTGTTEDVAHVAEIMGNGKFALIASGTLYLYGALLKKQKSKRVALLLLESYVITGFFTQFTKYMTGRWRPNNFPPGEEKYNYWEGPRFLDPRKSFFSGHSATSFTIATTLAVEFKHKPWVGILAYSLASVSNLSRIHDRAHWASDVFIGSAIGLVMTRTIIRRHTCEGSPRALLYPSFLQGSQGLGFRYVF